MVFCAIWYHLYNLKNVKNIHGGVFILINLQASACNFTESNTAPWVFFTFFKLYKWYQIARSVSYRTLPNIHEITFLQKANDSVKSFIKNFYYRYLTRSQARLLVSYHIWIISFERSFAKMSEFIKTGSYKSFTFDWSTRANKLQINSFVIC